MTEYKFTEWQIDRLTELQEERMTDWEIDWMTERHKIIELFNDRMTHTHYIGWNSP